MYQVLNGLQVLLWERYYSYARELESSTSIDNLILSHTYLLAYCEIWYDMDYSPWKVEQKAKNQVNHKLAGLHMSRHYIRAFDLCTS